MTKPENKAKPRIRFCWVCSKKLRGNSFSEVTFNKDGLKKIVHKDCETEVNQ